MNEFGEFPKILRGLRQSSGCTQQDVAQKLGIAYQSYQAYERGVALPTLKNFVAIADLFDVSLDYLLGRKELERNTIPLPPLSPTMPACGKILHAAFRSSSATD